MRFSSYLDKDELATLTGVTEALVRQLTRDHTLPPRFVLHGYGTDKRAIGYRSECVALILLLEELQHLVGTQSPLPKKVVVEMAGQIEEYWRTNDNTVNLTISHGSVSINTNLGFLRRAKQIVAQRAVA